MTSRELAYLDFYQLFSSSSEAHFGGDRIDVRGLLLGATVARMLTAGPPGVGFAPEAGVRGRVVVMMAGF